MGCLDHPHIPFIAFLRHVYYCLAGMEAPGKRGFLMNWLGWIFMIAAWTFIGGIFLFSFKRILFSNKSPYDNHAKEQKQKVHD